MVESLNRSIAFANSSLPRCNDLTIQRFNASQNFASSSGPKSARIWPSTSITGARRWPERLTISVMALLSAITSSVSYWMPRSSSQCCALWHQPQYGLMKRRIFIDEHLSTDRHRIFIEWRQPERFRQMVLHWNQSLHRRLATPNLFNNGMNRLLSMVIKIHITNPILPKRMKALRDLNNNSGGIMQLKITEMSLCGPHACLALNMPIEYCPNILGAPLNPIRPQHTFTIQNIFHLLLPFKRGYQFLLVLLNEVRRPQKLNRFPLSRGIHNQIHMLTAKRNLNFNGHFRHCYLN